MYLSQLSELSDGSPCCCDAVATSACDFVQLAGGGGNDSKKKAGQLCVNSPSCCQAVARSTLMSETLRSWPCRIVTAGLTHIGQLRKTTPAAATAADVHPAQAK